MTQDKDPKTPGDELREALSHLFSAARKAARTVEPHVHKPLEDAERLLEKLGRGGESVAVEVGKEVAAVAARLADRLRAISDRAEGNTPSERPPTDPPSGDDPPRT